MKCARPDCGRDLRPEQVRASNKYCSQRCACAVNAARRRVKFPAPLLLTETEDRSFRMRCHNCAEWYDGRKGSWVGLCSPKCLGEWLPKLLVAQAAEAERWRKQTMAKVKVG